MLKQDIKVTVDALLFCRAGLALQVLLIQRKNEPGTGKWALPGGFVEDDEDLEPAAIRELEEETGIKLPLFAMHQITTVGTPGRDSRFRTVSVVYYAIIDKNAHPVQANDDAADAQWFDVKELPEIAFDHEDIIMYGLSR
jgi:8-oxo-dGTP diphosphatase